MQALGMNTMPTDEQILPGMSDASHASVPEGCPSPLHVVAGGTPAIASVQAPGDHSKHGGSIKPFVPAVKRSVFVKVNLNNPEYASRYQQCVAHALVWSRTRLEGYYKAEYNSFRSRKQQAKSKHIKFDDSLKDFRDWLVHLGPWPADQLTVHRMNNYKGYQPGNLKWATKTEQTEIRKVTKWHDVNGKQMTTKQFAKLLGVSYTCLYKRLRRGWTAQRLLDSSKKNTGIKAWQFPDNLAYYLESQYATRKYFPQSRLEWYITYLEKMLKKANLVLPEEKSKQELLVTELLKAEALRDSYLKAHEEQVALEVELIVAALSHSQVTASGAADSGLAEQL